jgi:hypothetical protein
MQWQMGMHGFAEAKSERERALTRAAGPAVPDATAEERRPSPSFEGHGAFG